MTKIELKAIQKINDKGILLVYPIKNQSEPASLWSEFYPRTKMDWSWDSDSDNRVGHMWMLMKRLSDSGHVVYSKWYKGRATFFSKELFKSLLVLARAANESKSWPHSANSIYEVLSSDSPLSTKVLKKQTELVGKDLAAEFDRSMRFLYQHFLIVGFGEVDDGAFPSSSVGASELLFEDLWNESRKIPLTKAHAVVNKYMPEESLARAFLNKVLTVTRKETSPEYAFRY